MPEDGVVTISNTAGEQESKREHHDQRIRNGLFSVEGADVAPWVVRKLSDPHEKRSGESKANNPGQNATDSSSQGGDDTLEEAMMTDA